MKICVVESSAPQAQESRCIIQAIENNLPVMQADVSKCLRLKYLLVLIYTREFRLDSSVYIHDVYKYLDTETFLVTENHVTYKRRL